MLCAILFFKSELKGEDEEERTVWFVMYMSPWVILWKIPLTYWNVARFMALRRLNFKPIPGECAF